MESRKYTSVNEYISTFPIAIQEILQQLREIIKTAAPESTEIISYNMPAYKQNTVLVYFAANKNHIGFYPTSLPIIVFKEELQKFKTSKGSIHFPLDSPLPVSLITTIVKYRSEQDSNTKKTR